MLRRVGVSGPGWAARVTLFCLAAALVLTVAEPAEARRKKTKRAAYSPPYAAIVVDVKSGRVLHANNPDATRHPASITKVMTLYMLFEQLEAGKLRLNSELRVSANAARQAPSKIGFRPGETIEVEDAIKALVTKSANDVAVTVAENLAGSEETFAQRMTERARQLGMSRTVFRNASGLPNPGQITTARDLSVLARAIQERFPRYYTYFSTRSFNYAGTNYRNHNKLLGRVEGVDGIKTGYIRASGFNLMTSARTDDRHVVAIVLGGRTGAHRDNIMASLVEDTLPRAYAGARTAPPVAVAATARPRPAVVAAAPAADTARPAAVPGKPLDLNAARPVTASAYASTSTPAAFRWVEGDAAAMRPPAAVPQQAAAAAASPVGKMQDRIEPVVTASLPAAETRIARSAPASAAPAAALASSARPTAATPSSPWVIQIGATDDESKAKAILAQAKARSQKVLRNAEPFTQKIVRDGNTLFRARFAGFEEADAAQNACKALKRSGIACFATRG